MSRLGSRNSPTAPASDAINGTAIGNRNPNTLNSTSLLLGWFFAFTLHTSLAWGVALGAIVSPTDAVATAIGRRVGVPHRVLTMLEGESLLNDATALVLLRSAVAAAAGTVALGSVVLDFCGRSAPRPRSVSRSGGCTCGCAPGWPTRQSRR